MDEKSGEIPGENPIAAVPVTAVPPMLNYATGESALSIQSGAVVTVASYANAVEAAMHAALLEDDGIVSHVLNANVNSLGIPYSGFSSVDIQVRLEDAARAKEILETDPDELEPAGNPAGGPHAVNEHGDPLALATAGAYANVRRLREAQAVLASSRIRAFPPRLINRGDRPPGEGKRFVLRVSAEDAERARALLADADAEDEADEDPRCPKCKSFRVYPVPQFWRSFLAFWGIGKWPEKEMECLACRHRGAPAAFE